MNYNRFGCQFLLLTVVLGFSQSCTQNVIDTNAKKKNHFAIDSVEEFSFNSSIRAIEVVNDSAIWFAGSNGLVGRTFDNGTTWLLDTLKYDTLIPNFRSLTITEEDAFVLSIESPALLYKYSLRRKQWQIVYKEEHPQVFYDALKVESNGFGIAVGDAISSCLSVIITTDGGESWKKLDCGKLPKVELGEALFAASNTGVEIIDSSIWIATGGKKSRIFKSTDLGQTWKVIETPFTQGGQMTGMYSIDFWDKNNGIAVGGDWSDLENNIKNIATTIDGGETWNIVSDSVGPGYRTCVKYLPEGNGQELLAIGKGGLSYSSDAGLNWKELNVDGYYSLSIGSSREGIWLGGNNKIGRILTNSK